MFEKIKTFFTEKWYIAIPVTIGVIWFVYTRFFKKKGYRR